MVVVGNEAIARYPDTRADTDRFGTGNRPKRFFVLSVLQGFGGEGGNFDLRGGVFEGNKGLGKILTVFYIML